MAFGPAYLATRPALSVAPRDLDINSLDSIHSVASTVAYGTMKYYTGNITNTPETIAIFPKPHYWWQAGACWGAMLDYSHYTGDRSYDHVTTEALLSQVGTQFDFMSSMYSGSEGNDDQAFWAFAVLEAAERNFPQPDDSIPPWLQIAENIWNTMVVRWDDTTCGGGLHWQIYSGNPNGLDYKNSVSNGGFFQISARLARATGNETYFQWASKVWDWSKGIGLIDEYFNVLDGGSSKEDCKNINPLSFSYTQGIYMYGAAVLFNYTDGDEAWAHRTDGLLQASRSYFSPFPNATNIMYEHACEQVDRCNTDMLSFKGYLSRFMGATAQLMPSTLDDVQELLNVSALAAGKACSGGDAGIACGEKWYVGGYDENTGLGQQMAALETIQALLASRAKPPLKHGEIRHVTGVDNLPPDTPSTTSFTPTILPTTSITSSPAATSPTTEQPEPDSSNIEMGSLWIIILTMLLVLDINV